MSNDSNIHQFDPSTVSRLFKLCNQPETDEMAQLSESDKTELLRSLLDTVPPLDNVTTAEVPKTRGHLHESPPHVPGHSLAQILGDPATPLADLCSIKGYAKSLMSKARTEDGHDAAGVIYYAAIACAIVRYDTRTTQHSYRQLLDFFTSLLARKWISRDFKSLFEKARDRCAQHRSKDRTSH